MASTKARSRTAASSNGALDRTREAGDGVARTARRVGRPALAAGAAAAGLAGGLLVGSRVDMRRSRRTRRALALAAVKNLASAAGKASNTADDLRAIREQLENANRRSPIEVVLDGLTHRPGTGKRERRLG
jgi:hypothetical protein